MFISYYSVKLIRYKISAITLLSSLEQLVQHGEKNAVIAQLVERDEARIDVEVEERDEQEQDVNQEAIAWLESRQVNIESCYEPDSIVDGLLDELSLYLGEHYAVLKRFHNKLRSNIGRKLYFDLKGLDTREKSIHKQYLKRLKSSDFLRIGRNVKNTGRSDYLVATSHERSDVKGFLDGGWFERFIYYKSIKLFES